MTDFEKICDELNCDFGDIIHYEKKNEVTIK
ncbi:helix-turn-helix domain-containing protein [Eshraghiella crossota]